MSKPLQIRDAAYDLLAVPFALFQTKRKSPLPTLQEAETPALSVFILSENSEPDGQGNQGEIKFINDTIIGIAITRAYSDPLLLQGQLDADADLIKSTLLTNAKFTKMGPGALFESVERVRRTWMEASEGEAYLAELRIEMTFRHREDFAPTITDTLEEIDVKTTFPNDGTDRQRSRTQQVSTKYTL